MLLSPVLARWVIAPLGRIVGHPFGMVGQLARTNAIRNPRRTAATAFALTIGLVLVAGVAVLGSSAKASVAKLVNTSVRADYILTTRVSVGVPQAAVAAARKLDGVRSITELHELSASIDGKHYFGDAVDGPLGDAVDLHLEQGSLAISGDAMLVSHHTAAQRGWRLGSSHTFSIPGEAPITRKITGSYSDNQLIGPWLVSGDVYRALTPASQRTDIVALLHASPGANLSALRRGLERVTNRFYVVDVQSRSEFEGQVASQINGLIGLLYGLLGLAIVIAILGIITTLALSVIERRREVGMLRAIGMQRAGVRRTIYLESLLIAVFGATLGLALGLGYGALLTNALHDQGLDVLSVPWAQSVGFLAVAAVIGVLSAVWPSIRAARTRPLAAIGAP
jgi:putative ABC transport system permease protein